MYTHRNLSNFLWSQLVIQKSSCLYLYCPCLVNSLIKVIRRFSTNYTFAKNLTINSYSIWRRIIVGFFHMDISRLNIFQNMLLLKILQKQTGHFFGWCYMSEWVEYWGKSWGRSKKDEIHTGKSLELGDCYIFIYCIIVDKVLLSQRQHQEKV